MILACESTIIGRKVNTDNHCAQRMNPAEFSKPLTFHLKVKTNPVKYLNIFKMGYYKSHKDIIREIFSLPSILWIAMKLDADIHVPRAGQHFNLPNTLFNQMQN